MKNRPLLSALIVLAVVTVILAVIHLGARPQVSEGELLIQTETQLLRIRPGAENLVPVTGTLVNGKGDETSVDTTGLPLQEILQHSGIAGYQTVTVTARDEYHAEVNAEEIEADGKVYLTVDADGTFRLVIFGDDNSKRNVSDVIQLTIS